MTSTARRSNTEEISNVIDVLADALRKKNVEGVVSVYAPDNVMFVLAPPLQYTKENAPSGKGVEAWFSTFDGPLGYELRDLKITSGNDIAFSHSLSHLTGKKTSGEAVDLWYRETLCFQRLGSEWKIAHQHESVPFYMDGSGKAATDLKP